MAHWLNHDAKKEWRGQLILYLKRPDLIMFTDFGLSPNTKMPNTLQKDGDNPKQELEEIMADEYKFIIMAGMNSSEMCLMPVGSCIILVSQLQHHL